MSTLGSRDARSMRLRTAEPSVATGIGSDGPWIASWFITRTPGLPFQLRRRKLFFEFEVKADFIDPLDAFCGRERPEIAPVMQELVG
jgi:hypothetical protein